MRAYYLGQRWEIPTDVDNAIERPKQLSGNIFVSDVAVVLV